MRQALEIENIEQLRHKAGIDDVELRAAICRLRVGDSVKLTFKAGATSPAGETLRVRITSIQGCRFRGKLSERPELVGLSKLRVGSAVRFPPAHIHSIPNRSTRTTIDGGASGALR